MAMARLLHLRCRFQLLLVGVRKRNAVSVLWADRADEIQPNRRALRPFHGYYVPAKNHTGQIF